MRALNTIIYCEIVHNYVDQNLGDVDLWKQQFNNKTLTCTNYEINDDII